MTNTTISCETAEQVLASVKSRYNGFWDSEVDAPVLIENYMDTGCWGVVWECGPFDWAYRVSMGGVSEEVYFTLIDEFGVDSDKARRSASEVPLEVPDVELQPYYSYSFVIVSA